MRVGVGGVLYAQPGPSIVAPGGYAQVRASVNYPNDERSPAVDDWAPIAPGLPSVRINLQFQSNHTPPKMTGGSLFVVYFGQSRIFVFENKHRIGYFVIDDFQW